MADRAITLSLGTHEADRRRDALKTLAYQHSDGNISAMIQQIADGQLKVEVRKMKWFKSYDEAREYALGAGEPLWDTHTLPWRYGVGHLSIDDEEDPANAEWEQLDPREE